MSQGQLVDYCLSAIAVYIGIAALQAGYPGLAVFDFALAALCLYAAVNEIN